MRWLRREREPSNQRRQFFVLRPRRAEGTAEIGDATRESARREAQYTRCLVQEFASLMGLAHKAAAGAGVEQRFAKEFAIGGVNQRMRRQNIRQVWQRPSRRQNETATRQPVALLCRFSWSLRIARWARLRACVRTPAIKVRASSSGNLLAVW